MIYTDELLNERQQVIDVVNQLFIQTDNRNWVAVQRCFADLVEMDMTSLTGGEPQSMTPTEITDSWEENLKNLDAIHHQTGNFVVDVHGPENAHVLCYGTAWHYRPTDSGQNTRIYVGAYEFDLLKENGMWRINTFWFDCKFIDGNVALE